jgi:rsbT co-antagonist protein RsbR
MQDDQETIAALRQRVAELEQQLDKEQVRIFRTMVESAPYSITISSLEGLLTYANPAHQQTHGYVGSTVGMRLDQIMPDADELQVALNMLIAEGRWSGVITHQRADGSTFPMQCDAFFVFDEAGAPTGTVVIERDVSIEVQQELERTSLQQQVIAAQQAAIRELSTPLLPIADQVLVMPLVGSIDSMRAQQVLETLLTGVADYQSRLVILDITGVQVVDTQVASAFMRAAQAVQLLGAEVLITGIQPAMAQTLVALGVDFATIKTRATLQAGVAEALRISRSTRA